MAYTKGQRQSNPIQASTSTTRDDQDLSFRQIAKALTNEGILQISHNPVTDILENIGLTTPFLPISHLN